MKKEFEMTQDELNQMIGISQGKSMPVLMIGGHVTGGEKQDAANDFWKALGEKYGFIWDQRNQSKAKDILSLKQLPSPTQWSSTRLT